MQPRDHSPKLPSGRALGDCLARARLAVVKFLVDVINERHVDHSIYWLKVQRFIYIYTRTVST